MRRKQILLIATLLAITLMTACGGSGTSATSTTTNTTQPSNNNPVNQGATFITGEDTPLPAVIAFNVTLSSVKLTNSSTSVEALSTPTTVDFARLVGLRALLGFNSVTAGSYTSATITLNNPVISFLDLSTTPAGVGTINGTFAGSATPATTTVTVALSKPLVVSSTGLTGLHMHFSLRDSLQLDGAGQLTGVVDPKIQLAPVRPTDDDAQVTDLRGALISVNVAENSFVIQRPGGRQITIAVNGSTSFNGNNSLSTLAPPAKVEVDGQVQSDGSILASDVEVVAITNAFIAGPIVNVSPTSGAVQTVTILVSESLPDLAGITPGFPQTIDISQVQNFDIRRVDNWISNFVFNNTSLVPGQFIGIGGTLDTTKTPPALVPSRVVLMRQGVDGDLVSGSVTIVSGNQGSFQIQNNRLLGYILGAPLDVSTDNKTRFPNINGLTGLQSAGNVTLSSFGLMLKDNNTGNVRMYAHGVKVQQ